MPGKWPWKTASLMQVRGDLLMAIQTQLRLAIAIGAVVAQRALLFVFHVSGAQLARHQECLRIHGFSGPSSYQYQHQPQSQQCVTSSPRHVGGGTVDLVHVNRNHVNDRGNDHDEDQRYVQRVPQ